MALVPALAPALALATIAALPAAAEPAVRRGACEAVAYEDPAAAAGADDDGEDSETGSADAAGSGASGPIGFAFGADGCATVEGSFAAIAARSQPRLADPRLQALAGRPFWSGQLGGTATLTTTQTIGGLFVGTTVSVIGFAHPVPSLLFGEASLRVGRLQAGYGLSRFNYWSVDLFSSSLLTAGRTTAFAAFDLVKPSPWSVTLALEDPALPSPDAAGVPPLLPGVLAQAPPWRPGRTPDVIVRARYETDSIGLHAAAALRPRDAGGAAGPGLALTLAASWTFSLGGLSHNLAGQAIYARDMPRYLGTSFDVATLRALVRPDDRTEGASAVASWTQDWTPRLSSGVFASRIWMSFPAAGPRGGSLAITRAVANLTYKPAARVRLSVELGFGQASVNLPDRVIQPFEASGRSYTLTLASAVAF